MNPRTLTEPATDARLIDALAEIVGHTHVLTDPELIEGYTRDWTGRWIGDAIAVIRPGNTSEVSAVLRACFDAGVPVTPQGGNTGLVGGGTPDDSGTAVLLSLSRMNKIRDLDPLNDTITVEAGVVLAEIITRMTEGRRALWRQGRSETGPYQSPLEDGMVHFHEFLRREIGPRLAK